MKEKYRQALSEVYIILKNTDEEIRNKIPDKFIEFIKNNMDNNHKFEIEPGKELVEQNLMLETKQILALIYRDYICEEKESSKNKEKYDINFNKTSNLEKLELIEVSKEKWYKKIINKILKIFNIKNN